MALILGIEKAFHLDLDDGDECFYLRDYYRSLGFQGGDVNDRVINFKKSVRHKGEPQYYYKTSAINQISKELLNALSEHLQVENPIFCPIPPSKSKSDPLYDDRLIQVLENVQRFLPIQIHEFIETLHSHEAQHAAEIRMGHSELKDHFSFIDLGVDLNDRMVFLFDDVITNGRHFKICKSLILERYPRARVIGLFYARTIDQVDLDIWDPFDDML